MFCASELKGDCTYCKYQRVASFYGREEVVASIRDHYRKRRGVGGIETRVAAIVELVRNETSVDSLKQCSLDLVERRAGRATGLGRIPDGVSIYLAARKMRLRPTF